MESAELAKLVFSRVQKVDPDNVSKIVGCILLREPDEDEMVQLAYGPQSTLVATVVDAKAALAGIYARCSSVHYAGAAIAAAGGGYHQQQYCSHPAAGLRHLPPSFSFHVPAPYWPDSSPALAGEKTPPECAFVDAAAETHYPRAQRGGLDDHLDAAMGSYYYASAAAEEAFHSGNAVASRSTTTGGGRRSNGISSRRPCHYFFKGVCKNGQNCHYSHHHLYSDGFAGGAMDHLQGGGATPGSLERLELEITELLHSRRGQPVSIASLPTLYGEKYGKGLQADGYLTESQRHGKAGYSLTKLLSRLNKIRVIERFVHRPHGQHSVVLAEDAAKYTDCRSDRGGDMPASSHQIYLTFPSDSTFTEDDVATYFGQYGAVRDVRIPCQDQRMFGFVSFQNPETVTSLLMRRNPHFIGGSRVLAKPYREKSKCINDRTKTMVQGYSARWIDTEAEFYPELYDSPKLERRQLAEKRERLFELERRRLAGLRTEPLLPQFAYFDCSIGDDVAPFTSQSAGSKEVDVVSDPLDVVSTSQPPDTQTSSNYDNQESSSQIELLPESPFASSSPTETSL